MNDSANDIRNKPIRRVVIAGGGTAGWMAAAALSRTLGKVLDITLVESEEIGTVGVGEATIPTLVTFHRLLDIKEQEYMSAVKGTIKLGISFENWLHKGHRYIHSFGMSGKDHWSAGFQHFWQRGRELGIAGGYEDYCFELKAALQDKFAHLPRGGINYAYHMDASLYARFLRTLSQGHGAKRVEGKIVEVQTDQESGYITALKLADGSMIEGDLFIDCTGFRALLIGKTLNVGFEDWSHWLFNDSALATQTTAVRDAVPYTRAIAGTAGWQWRIPLQHRVGNGIVYSSRYISDDEARAGIPLQPRRRDDQGAVARPLPPRPAPEVLVQELRRAGPGGQLHRAARIDHDPPHPARHRASAAHVPAGDQRTRGRPVQRAARVGTASTCAISSCCTTR